MKVRPLLDRIVVEATSKEETRAITIVKIIPPITQKINVIKYFSILFYPFTFKSLANRHSWQ